jgi:hypothetical protein
MTAPSVGFKPMDPFAPVAAEVLPVDATVTTTPPAPTVTTPAAPPTAPAKPAKAADILSESLEGTKDLGTEPIEAVAEDESMLAMLVTDERIETLWQRIETAERLAVEDEASLPNKRVTNLENLKSARNLLLGGKKNYENALRYVVEVEADVLYAGRVRKWSYSWGTAILIYNLLWVVLLVLGGISADRVVEPFARSSLITREFGLVIWGTILFGGVGGLTKSFFAYVSHITKQDFDTQHRVWYWTCPIIGAGLGIFVLLFLGLTSFGPNVDTNPVSIITAFALAWVVGFQQNLVLELVERVKKLILPDKDKETSQQITTKE